MIVDVSMNSQDAPTELLPDDHPLWGRHSGGSGHDGYPEWDLDDDLPRAQAFYAAVRGKAKAKVFLDLLIDHPGRRLSVTEIRAMTGDLFADAGAVARSLTVLHPPRQASERRYPFRWWKGQPGQTQYGMKPQVAELFRRARTSMSDGMQSTASVPQLSGASYRPQDEYADVAPPAPADSADPDSFGRGLRSHRRLQNQLAQLVEKCGLKPLSPLAADPDYDLAWITGDETLMVVEVKSTTNGNEIRQLRMGLGQVLDYNDALQRRGFTVQPVLYVEREPAEKRWIEIARAAGVILGWPGDEDRLGLSNVIPTA
jgi:hypothetical protein